MIAKKRMLQALEGLIAGVDEIRRQFLADLRPWSNEFVAWLKAAESTLEMIFGSRSEAYQRFRAIYFVPPADEQQPSELDAETGKLIWFNSGLTFARSSLIGFRYSVERLAAEDEPEPTRPSPFVFLSHGGPSRLHVDAARDFLRALGLEPLIVADLPNLNMSINQKILRYMEICTAGIALATVEDETTAAEKRTRPNVENEIGMMQTAPNIGERLIYLKEPGVQFASNYAEKVWIEFHKERLQDAFTAIARELRAFGLVGWDA